MKFPNFFGFFKNIKNAIFSSINYFFKEYDIWFPNLINLLKTVSSAVTSFISEFLIQTVLLLIVWGISIYIEIHRIELGMNFLGADQTTALATSLFLAFSLQVIQHMIHARNLLLGEIIVEKTTLRHIIKNIKYRLGFSYFDTGQVSKDGKKILIWKPIEKRDTSLESIKSTIIATIIIIAFVGSASEAIKSVSMVNNASIPWYNSIGIIFQSSLKDVLTWFGIIMTTLCAVYFEVVISEYVAQQSHSTLVEFSQKAKSKVQLKSSEFVKTISYLRRRGDEITERSNSNFYINLEALDDKDYLYVDKENSKFKFYDGQKRDWSEEFNDYKEFRNYIRGVNDAR